MKAFEKPPDRPARARPSCQGRGVRAGVFFVLFAAMLLFGCRTENDKSEENPPDPPTRVVNLNHEEYDVYIGRGSNPRVHMLTEGIRPGEEGWLGNPHPIGWCAICGREHTREDCIEEFRKDFYEKLSRDPEFKMAVLSLKGKRLGCYCKPKKCHGDVIRDYIESGG